MNSIAKGVEHAVVVSTGFLEHINNNKIVTGAAGLSTFSAIVFLLKQLYKRYSSAGKNEGTLSIIATY